MEKSRRLFALQTAQFVAMPSSVLVPAALTGVTAIVVPRRAQAIAPMLLGGLVASALYEIFSGFGLTKQLVSAIASASARPADNPRDFDGMFSDDVELNVSQAWRFENGKIVGVDGATYGGDPYAPRRSSLNVNELSALRDPVTMSEVGAMVPTSMRLPPDSRRQRAVAAYKNYFAEQQRTRTSRIPDPMYARSFEKMGNGEKVAGVFGRAYDGSQRFVWIPERALA